MKKILLPFFALLFPLLLCGQQSYLNFEVGKTSELLADQVNVRSGPDKDEKILATLPIATEVEILETGDGGTEIKGINTPWVKVRYQQNGKSEEGYLWSGLLATESFVSKADPAVKILIGPDHVGEGQWGTAAFLQLRAVKNGKQIAKLVFEAIGDLGQGAYWEANDNLGVIGLHDIFSFGYSADYCAGPAGDVYIFWDGKTFFNAKTIYGGSDAPVFQEETLIFPTNEGGRPDRITFTHLSGENVNEGEDEIEEFWEETYIWTGKKLEKISR